jgi:SAM-dependent methyltransferase
MTARFGSADPGLNGRAFTAAQAFLLESKLYWTGTLHPALRDELDRAVERTGRTPETPDDVADLIADGADYRVFAWLERHLQRFKYSGRYGLQAYHDKSREALEASLDVADLPDGMLALDPDLDMPAYYTAIDIHQHPGGVWSDPLAGFVYERGARSTTPTLGARHEDLHTRFTDLVADRLDGAPETLFDMGCGFGKSTQPFATAFRETHVTGMDLSEPCLRLAAKTAHDAQTRNVRFVQGDATVSGLDRDSQDVVTSTMLLHELPPGKVEAALAEAYRVLKPGGTMIHLDFRPAPDPFAEFIHRGHSRRNNEPYMWPFAEMDLDAVLGGIGFVAVSVKPFAEADGALDPSNTGWRFPWAVIAAEKPA